MNTTPPQRSVYCSSCGHLNPPGRLACEKCNSRLVQPDIAPVARSNKRPGCVTAHVILLGFGFVILGLICLISLIPFTKVSDFGYGAYQDYFTAYVVGIR